MKVWVKGAFKSYSFFLHQKNNKKAERFCMTFCSNPNKSKQQAPQFQNFKIKIMSPLFCCPVFFEEYLKHQVRIKKWLTNIVLITIESFWINLNNKSSQISTDLLTLDLSQEFFVNFNSNQYIPPCLGRILKFMVFRLMENSFKSQQIESRHFSLRFLSSLPRQRETLLIHPKGSIFSKIYSLQQKVGGGNHGKKAHLEVLFKNGGLSTSSTKY